MYDYEIMWESDKQDPDGVYHFFLESNAQGAVQIGTIEFSENENLWRLLDTDKTYKEFLDIVIDLEKEVDKNNELPFIELAHKLTWMK